MVIKDTHHSQTLPIDPMYPLPAPRQVFEDRHPAFFSFFRLYRQLRYQECIGFVLPYPAILVFRELGDDHLR